MNEGSDARYTRRITIRSTYILIAMAILLLAPWRVRAFLHPIIQHSTKDHTVKHRQKVQVLIQRTRLFSSLPKNDTTADGFGKTKEEEPLIPPWSFDLLSQKRQTNKGNGNVVRVRQHVNPLARRFQQHTILSENWPKDVFEDCESKPLFLDIGAAKGGFLLKLASQRPSEYNYLGLEIRPLAVQFAQDRLKNNPEYSVPCTGHLDFVGCNANVDLRRLLSLYREAATSETPLEMVTIQFPDPHFKASHAKRRVVTPELVNTLPEFMPPGAKVFLQSDVQSVVDDMRECFREASLFFEDQISNSKEYYPENIIGVPTEREMSVLKQDLPVFRVLFVRTDAPSPSGRATEGNVTK